MKRGIKVLTIGCLFAAFAGTVPALAAAEKSPHSVALVMAQEDYSSVAVSQVTDYVNIREQATTGSKIVGKIYNNCAATILETVDGEGGKWYRIQSGTVTGYMKAQYFITGAEAEKLAQSIGREFVTINTETLRLREQPDLNSKTLTLLASGARYVVMEDAGDFFKVEVDADLVGYIAKSYCKTEVEFDQAVSLEEERAKLQEAADRKREADSAMAALEQVKRVEAKREADANITVGSAGVNVGTNVIDGNGGAAGNGSGTAAGGSSTAAGSNASGSTGAAGSSAGTASGNTGAAGGTTASGELIIAANPQQSDQSHQTLAPSVSAPQTNGGSAAAGGGASSITVAGNAPGGNSGNNGSGSGSNTVVSGSNTSSTVVSGGNSGTKAPESAAVVTATRTAIVAYAKQFLGNPYVYGGTSLTNGADCSGFTQQIYKHFGINTGRSSRDQAAKGKAIAVSAAQPGDLLFYASGDYINHVALYIGDGKVIHASNSTTGIIISPYNYRTPCKAVTFLD